MSRSLNHVKNYEINEFLSYRKKIYLEKIYSIVIFLETLTETNTIKNLKLTLECGVSMINIR